MDEIKIEGVTLHPLEQITVLKGDLWHILKSTDEGYAGFGEVYITQIEEGQTKGWKRHNRYILNLVVLSGAIKFVIYDDRKESESRGQFFEVTLTPNGNYQRLTLAPGLWMAFHGIGKGHSMLMDIIPEPHSLEEASKKNLEELSYNFE